MPNTAPITKAENDALLKELLADLEVRGAQYQQYLVDEMVKQAGGVKNPPLQVAAKEALPSFKEVNVMVKDKALVGAAGVHYVAFQLSARGYAVGTTAPGVKLASGRPIPLLDGFALSKVLHRNTSIGGTSSETA